MNKIFKRRARKIHHKIKKLAKKIKPAKLFQALHYTNTRTATNE